MGGVVKYSPWASERYGLGGFRNSDESRVDVERLHCEGKGGDISGCFRFDNLNALNGDAKIKEHSLRSFEMGFVAASSLVCALSSGAWTAMLRRGGISLSSFVAEEISERCLLEFGVEETLCDLSDPRKKLGKQRPVGSFENHCRYNFLDSLFSPSPRKRTNPIDIWIQRS